MGYSGRLITLTSYSGVMGEKLEWWLKNFEKKYCRRKSRFQIAALPPDVRKVSDLPALDGAMPQRRGVAPNQLKIASGKA